MTTLEYPDFLDDQSLTYYDEDVLHDFDAWSHSPHFEVSNNLICDNYLDDIKHTYRELHKCVDQVVAKFSSRKPMCLDEIRDHNRKVIEKLTTLENTILESAHTEDAIPVIPGSASHLYPSPTASDLTPPGGRRRHKRRRATSSSCPKAGELFPSAQNGARTESGALQGSLSSHDRLRGNPKLAEKLLHISNEESGLKVTRFASQLNLNPPEPGVNTVQLPNAHQFSSLSQIADASHFRGLILNLGVAIENSGFGEQYFRIRKRIALAHFYHTYTLAQDNPELFFVWCEGQPQWLASMLPKGGSRSAVQRRFADLIFAQPEKSSLYHSNHLHHVDDVKKRVSKIQMWRKLGKKWAQVIQRFGCGILLLLPSSLTDEE
ncbi:hypothetical protein JX265_010531 [Neoarthrinium moseri]|uniref:Uncharacterized protein n=1 Tax=Neoarthrinium moseri TaxID=1658444 RepID=A0A9P9WDY0_9PEZI|nr:uncharacterized protein JN550_012388 [Neoarthrinium moseri]KAI1846153.1 hypothetical protein JX266_007678 [Neoarthrinium moseri]KAI1858826.1 hypothetical protein JN550_012388 [Neoarthrinium moseri]KAI1859054.1 hypothetical protein JX265_010531 [Neoarthrinium moseri]